jgi:hypothetical protein
VLGGPAENEVAGILLQLRQSAGNWSLLFWGCALSAEKLHIIHLILLFFVYQVRFEDNKFSIKDQRFSSPQTHAEYAESTMHTHG